MGHLPRLIRHTLALLIAVVGCSTSMRMNDTGDETEALPTDNRLASRCSKCFSEDCAWQTTECSSDPGCARLLTCANEGPLDGQGLLDIDWLRNHCRPVEGVSATLWNSLVSCVTGSMCCEEVPENGGNPGSGGGGGGGIVPDAQSGAVDTGADQEYDSTCSQCLKELGTATDASSTDTQCRAALDDCKQGECHEYLTLYQECLTANTNSERGLEACMFQGLEQGKKLASNASSAAFAMFMQRVFGCLTGSCASLCVPADVRPCIACQQQSCGDDLALVRSSNDAILGIWCRSYCQWNQDEQCPGICTGFMTEAADILQSYGQCVKASCPEC